MNATPSLFDLAPLLPLLLLAAALAAVPLAWVWWRQRGRGPQAKLVALAAVALFLTFDLIVIGAFTRLSDSGLGCPDWPGCYGEASPLGARDDIHAAQAAAPGGPVTWSKAWIEMIHRYLAMTVGVLILVMTVASWLARRRLPLSPWWPTATLVWVCAQGAFGALTVTLKLFRAEEDVIARLLCDGSASLGFGEPTKIEIYDGKEENLILIDTKNKKITIQSKTGDIHLEAKETVSIKAKNIKMDSEQNTTSKAGSNIKHEASGNVEIKAGGQMTIEAGGTCTVKGSTINLN